MLLFDTIFRPQTKLVSTENFTVYLVLPENIQIIDFYQSFTINYALFTCSELNKSNYVQFRGQPTPPGKLPT